MDDSMLDFMAEAVKMKARLAEYDCRVDFKAFARERFEKFTGREVQGLLNSLLEIELDLDTLIKSKIVLDFMYLHNTDTQKSIEKSFISNSLPLFWSLVFGGASWEKNI